MPLNSVLGTMGLPRAFGKKLGRGLNDQRLRFEPRSIT